MHLENLSSSRSTKKHPLSETLVYRIIASSTLHFLSRKVIAPNMKFFCCGEQQKYPCFFPQKCSCTIVLLGNPKNHCHQGKAVTPNVKNFYCMENNQNLHTFSAKNRLHKSALEPKKTIVQMTLLKAPLNFPNLISRLLKE